MFFVFLTLPTYDAYHDVFMIVPFGLSIREPALHMHANPLIIPESFL
jgi:hypothetical protein